MLKYHSVCHGARHSKQSLLKAALSPFALYYLISEKPSSSGIAISLTLDNINTLPTDTNCCRPKQVVSATFTPKPVLVLTPERDTLGCCNRAREVHPKTQIQTRR